MLQKRIYCLIVANKLVDIQVMFKQLEYSEILFKNSLRIV